MIRSIKTILCSIKMVLLQLNQTKLRIFLVFRPIFAHCEKKVLHPAGAMGGACYNTQMFSIVIEKKEIVHYDSQGCQQ